MTVNSVTTGKPVQDTQEAQDTRYAPDAPDTQTRAHRTVRGSEMNFAGKSVPRHLARGAIGFGLIIGPIALVPVVGPAILLATPLALIAFRGCPTCWMVCLAQTISRGRLERQCEDGACTLTKAQPAEEGPR